MNTTNSPQHQAMSHSKEESVGRTILTIILGFISLIVFMLPAFILALTGHLFLFMGGCLREVADDIVGSKIRNRHDEIDRTDT